MNIDEPVGRSSADTENANDAELANVLDTYLAAVEAGQPMDPEQVLADHPAIASRLRVCLAGLGLVEQEGRVLRGDPEQEDLPLRELGDYRLLRELGRGGMGIVYEAEQISLRRRVALKVLPLAATLDPRQLQRFQAEARAAALLQHPNIVPVYAVGCEQGVYFYVMQLIEGQSLAALLQEMRHPSPIAPGESATQQLDGSEAVASLSPAPLSPRPIHPTPVTIPQLRELIALAAQAAEALDYAHQFGIIHRDIKPGNLLLDNHGRLWVSDFGLALFTPDQRLTQTGDMVGTLRYMSPEQARAQRGLVDHRTDIYALGATLYELLTLQPLLTGGDAQTLLLELGLKEPTPPRRLNRAITPELELVLLKAVAKSVEERYTTARDFAADLRNVLEDRQIRARPPTLSQRLSRWARRHRQMVGTALVLLVLAVVGLTITATVVSLALHDRTRALGQLRDEKSKTDAALVRERRNAARFLGTLAAHDWEQGKVGRVLELLDQCPQEERHWEWRYLKRQCQYELLAFRGHADMVYSVDLSPDGKLLATGSRDGGVRFWDAVTGREVRRIRVLSTMVTQVAFSPEGDRLAATGQPGRVRVYRVADGAMLGDMSRSEDTVIWGIAWHPEGRLLAATSGTGVTIWDVERRVVTRELQVGNKSTCGVAFGSTGGRVMLAASSEGGTVKVWDAATWAERVNRHYANSENSPAFSPDGRWLAVPSGNGVELVGVADGRTGPRLRGHQAKVYTVVFSPDGKRIATGSMDRTVHLWDATTGGMLRRYRTHSESVHALHFSPDGRRLYTGSLDGTAKLVDVTAQQESRSLVAQDRQVMAVAFSPDSRLLATGDLDGLVRLWDAREGRLLHVLRGHTEFVRAVAFVAGGRWLASAGHEGPIRLWDVQTGEALRVLENDGEVVTLTTDADGRRLASATARGPVLGIMSTEIRLWDVESGEALARYRGPFMTSDWSITGISAALSPDGNLLAWPELGSAITVREATTGREVFRCRGSYHLGCVVGFSPDGRQLAASGAKGSKQDARLWQLGVPGPTVEEREPIQFLLGHTSAVSGVAFSPDGHRLATAGMDRTVRLWDLETGWEALTLTGDDTWIQGVAFSPDGNLLAAGTGNGLARIWDASPTAP